MKRMQNGQAVDEERASRRQASLSSITRTNCTIITDIYNIFTTKKTQTTFIRHHSRFEVGKLPFSTIGSLNGVHMFGKAQKIQLLNTLSEDYTVVWQEFHDSLVIIAIATGCTVEILNKAVESIFNAIVLIVGIEEVKSQKNVERLKRELRICYSIMDRLLDSLDCGDSGNKHSSDLLGMVETIMCSENHLIQIVLDSFTECIDSEFSCILIHGKLAIATENWWSLHSEELKLLSLLASADNPAVSKDIPVFLPYKSPGVAFRFVCCTLIPDVQLCCLCGPTPSLSEIEHSAKNCFKNSADIFTAASECFPRNFPASCHVDAGILGLLLVNLTKGKYMITRNPHQNATANKKAAGSSHRLDILKTFFYQSVRTILIDEETVQNEDNSNQNSETNVGNVGKETYWCSEYHKCYAMRIGENILSVLYNASIPTYAMRLMTEKTFNNLLSDKQTCW